MWGIRPFCHFCPEECGALVGGFILIQDGGDRSRKDFWVHFGTFEPCELFSHKLFRNTDLQLPQGCFLQAIKTNPHLYPGVRGGGRGEGFTLTGA